MKDQAVKCKACKWEGKESELHPGIARNPLGLMDIAAVCPKCGSDRIIDIEEDYALLCGRIG